MSGHMSKVRTSGIEYRRSPFHVVALLACVLPLVIGCQGCRDSDEDAKKEEQTPREAVTPGTL
ncbi:MAG: hypothetical protein KDA44_23360, partial [Planctomycetales bacterium]|nr:hypothetical protein [Planctomycetales bacterium]